MPFGEPFGGAFWAEKGRKIGLRSVEKVGSVFNSCEYEFGFPFKGLLVVDSLIWTAGCKFLVLKITFHLKY